MKQPSGFLFPVLTCILLFSGCGEAPPVQTAEGSSEEVQTVPTKNDLHAKLMVLQHQLNAFAQEHDLSADQAIAQAQQMYFEAATRYSEARHEHPELEELFAMGDALMQQAFERKDAGDEAGFESLMVHFRDVQQKLEEKTQELPELQELAVQLQAAEAAAVSAMADAAAVVNEEGKKIAEQMKDLREDIEYLLDGLE